jgi:hypothetical protein
VLSLGNRVSSFEFPPAIAAWSWSTTGRTAWNVSLRAEIEARSNYREAERRVSTLLLSKLEKQTGEKLERWQASPIVIDRELRLNKSVHIWHRQF